MAWEDQVVGTDTDLGHDLERRVGLAPVRRRRGDAHERGALAGRTAAGQRQIGQVHDLDANAAGAAGQAGHGCDGGLRGFGQRREHGEVADDPPLAFDEEQRRGAGLAHRIQARTPATLSSIISSSLQLMPARISSQCSLNSGDRLGAAGAPPNCTGVVTRVKGVPSAVAVWPR